MLTEAQQERFARHLLLDGLEGQGQERLLAARALVRLPAGLAQVARWAVRYLAASGVGALVLDGVWAEEVARECAAQWPEVSVAARPGGSEPFSLRIVALADGPQDVAVAAVDGLDAAGAAALGTRAALEGLLLVAGRPAAQVDPKRSPR